MIFVKIDTPWAFYGHAGNLSPKIEHKRLETLYRYQILDTPEDAAFDRVTKLAARLFEAPIAVIALTDRERQWIKSHFGLSIAEIPRQNSFAST